MSFLVMPDVVAARRVFLGRGAAVLSGTAVALQPLRARFDTALS